MNRTRIQIASLLLAIAVLATGSSAFASSWAFNSSGSNARFTWSNGQHLAGYPDQTAHGSPVVTQDGFFFVNAYGDMQFRAEVGAKETVHSSIYAYLSVAGTPVDQIIVREYGTWGGDQAALSVQADFLVYDWVAYSDTSVDMPDVTFLPNHTWFTQYTYVPDPTLTEFDFSVVNMISATDTLTRGTYIEKTGLEIIVPEPATMLLVLAALPLLVRWNRR
jgi:hypothetical protein